MSVSTMFAVKKKDFTMVKEKLTPTSKRSGLKCPSAETKLFKLCVIFYGQRQSVIECYTLKHLYYVKSFNWIIYCVAHVIAHVCIIAKECFCPPNFLATAKHRLLQTVIRNSIQCCMLFNIS